jgi:hypothetical protein
VRLPRGMYIHVTASICALVLLFGWSGPGSAAAPALKRDPFEEPAVIKEQRSVLTGQRISEYGVWKPDLRATMRSSSGAMANIDGKIIKVGEEVAGFLLVDVSERSAIFEKYGKRIVISMDEDDGKDETP